MAPPSRSYQPEELIPGTIYRVQRLIGAGGMGTVYDVEDTTIGKRYVLKTLHPQLGQRQDLARRLQNEARTIARLNHPNIVEVVTAGITGDDLRLPFYVMERLNGQSLRFVLEKKGRLELAHAYRITIDLLDALDHAHDKGVVHRDVKPDNIFLHRSLSGVTVTKLLDFGIVSLLDGGGGAVPDTRGHFLGTLRYAAPEQLRGEKPTPKVDLYAAALVLYEMVTGAGPFDDEEENSRIVAAHMNRVAPLLSRSAVVPPELDKLMRSALEKDPQLRPRDAFSFAASLRNFTRSATPPPSDVSPQATLPQVGSSLASGVKSVRASSPDSGRTPFPPASVASAIESSLVSASGPRSLRSQAQTLIGMTAPSVVGEPTEAQRVTPRPGAVHAVTYSTRSTGDSPVPSSAYAVTASAYQATASLPAPRPYAAVPMNGEGSSGSVPPPPVSRSVRPAPLFVEESERAAELSADGASQSGQSRTVSMSSSIRERPSSRMVLTAMLTTMVVVAGAAGTYVKLLRPSALRAYEQGSSAPLQAVGAMNTALVVPVVTPAAPLAAPAVTPVNATPMPTPTATPSSPPSAPTVRPRSGVAPRRHTPASHGPSASAPASHDSVQTSDIGSPAAAAP